MVGGISFGGLATGLDTDGIVAQLVAIRSRPKFLLQAQKEDLSRSLDLIGKLRESVERLGTASEALDTRDEFVSKIANSSDEDLFTASASSEAVLGKFDITVTTLAQGQREASQGFAATTDSVGTGTFRLTVDGTDHDFILADGADSLADLKAAINESDSGITASIVFDGTVNRLVLDGEEGSSKAFTIDGSGLSGGTAPAFSNLQTANNAALTVGGIAITSETNKIEGALEGITFDLNATGSSTLEVEGDDSELVDKLKEFADAYNSVVDSLNAQSAKGSQLNGSALLRSIQDRLRGVLGTSVATGGNFRITAEAGLALDQDGRISLDEEDLQEALSVDYDSVVNLFTTNQGVDGIAKLMTDTVDNLTDFSNGVFKTGTKAIDDRIQNIEDRIEREDRSIDAYRTLLNRKFSAMELTVSRLQSQGAYLGFGSGR